MRRLEIEMAGRLLLLQGACCRVVRNRIAFMLSHYGAVEGGVRSIGLLAKLFLFFC